MNLYPVLPAPGAVLNLDQPKDLAHFRSLVTPPQADWIRAVMVSNSAGDTVGPDGTSGSLTAGSDRELLKVLRSLADGIIVGANTLRVERIPVPSDTALVVFSHSGVIPKENIILPARDSGDLVVVTSPEGAPRVSHSLSGLPHRVIITKTDQSPATLAGAIRELVGGGALLIEGGRQMWESFAPVTDDLWLAVTPPPTNQRQGFPPWWPVPPEQWQLQTLFTDDAKMLYYRHTRLTGAPPEA